MNLHKRIIYCKWTALSRYHPKSYVGKINALLYCYFYFSGSKLSKFILPQISFYFPAYISFIFLLCFSLNFFLLMATSPIAVWNTLIFIYLHYKLILYTMMSLFLHLKFCYFCNILFLKWNNLWSKTLGTWL